jgi:DNA repair ATPase RecN
MSNAGHKTLLPAGRPSTDSSRSDKSPDRSRGLSFDKKRFETEDEQIESGDYYLRDTGKSVKKGHKDEKKKAKEIEEIKSQAEKEERRLDKKDKKLAAEEAARAEKLEKLRKAAGAQGMDEEEIC